MNTLFGQPARFPLRLTPEGVRPGAIGTIFDVEGLPTQMAPVPRVRIRIENYASSWVLPDQYEIVDLY